MVHWRSAPHDLPAFLSRRFANFSAASGELATQYRDFPLKRAMATFLRRFFFLENEIYVIAFLWLFRLPRSWFGRRGISSQYRGQQFGNLRSAATALTRSTPGLSVAGIAAREGPHGKTESPGNGAATA